MGFEELPFLKMITIFGCNVFMPRAVLTIFVDLGGWSGLTPIVQPAL